MAFKGGGKPAGGKGGASKQGGGPKRKPFSKSPALSTPAGDNPFKSKGPAQHRSDAKRSGGDDGESSAPKKKHARPSKNPDHHVGDGAGRGASGANYAVDGGAASGPSKVAVVSRKGGRKRTLEDGDDLLSSFKARIEGGTFRMLNEQLYTTPSAFAKQLLGDQETYDQYHSGYRRQLSLWPIHPAQLIVDSLVKDKRGRFPHNKPKHLPGYVPPTWVVADLGCGDALVSAGLEKAGLKNTVHNFDLAKSNDKVVVADMAQIPLEGQTVDIAIFSLSLMSTNYFDFLVEAHRYVKEGKLVKIVEVRSRLPKPEWFVQLIEGIGFRCEWWGVIGDYFCAFDFVRAEGRANTQPVMEPSELLMPCLYKRR